MFAASKKIKKMKKTILISFILIFTSILANATGDETLRSTTIVNGVVIDQQSGESLAGAEISVVGTNVKVYTDLDGRFTINNLTPGTYNIVISYISYNKSLVENLNIQAQSNQKIEVGLVSAE